VVVMPDTDTEFAFSVAERLRQSVEATPFPISRPPNAIKVTVSIGIATLDTADDTASTILKRADQALYRAKRDGRNRVVPDAA